MNSTITELVAIYKRTNDDLEARLKNMEGMRYGTEEHMEETELMIKARKFLASLREYLNAHGDAVCWDCPEGERVLLPFAWNTKK